MTHNGAVHSLCLGILFPLILAAVLQQSFATVAPPLTAQTTAAPHQEPGRPEMGTYTVRSSNGTACLMASMGLQLDVTFSTVQNKTLQQLMNIQPNVTNTTGSCEADSATLRLASADQTNLTFVFTLNATSNKYHLSEVTLSALWPDMKETFFVQNQSLNYLHGSMGHSYKCREKQTLDVAPNFLINTFQVQVQPFGLSGDHFSAAEECQVDEDDMLIPIIVGAALASLVLIVLLAYLIGRKRSHAGYQTI